MATNTKACYFVPPYFFEGLAKSEKEGLRHLAENDKGIRKKLNGDRTAFFQALVGPGSPFKAHAAGTAPGGPSHGGPPPGSDFHKHGFVPDTLLSQFSKSEKTSQTTKESFKKSLAISQAVHSTRATHNALAQQAQGTSAGSVAFRTIHDANHTWDVTTLPGKQVRREGQSPVADEEANKVYENLGKVINFFKDQFDWDSLDDRYMPVIASLHIGEQFANAFWLPESQQFGFGDGDSEFLYNFTGCLDVVGHEFTHGVNEHLSPLLYESESGALSEHLADAFGIMIKQVAQQETAETADWLLGEECIWPGVKGVALRSMKAPGTAYNDPDVGRDPQVDHYSKMIPNLEISEATDYGGVHKYSGIPNKAFYSVALAFGGFSWEKAGKIWWAALASGRIGPKFKFIQFADLTVDIAFEKYGEAAAKVVRKAWVDVGVSRRF